MPITFERVKVGKELKSQIIIQDLNNLGITEYQNQSLEELDYYTLRGVLAAARIRVESDSNKWF